jgi:hypothetical protein
MVGQAPRALFELVVLLLLLLRSKQWVLVAACCRAYIGHGLYARGLHNGTFGHALASIGNETVHGPRSLIVDSLEPFAGAMFLSGFCILATLVRRSFFKRNRLMLVERENSTPYYDWNTSRTALSTRALWVLYGVAYWRLWGLYPRRLYQRYNGAGWQVFGRYHHHLG